jgi:hypothetical protein
VCEKVSQNSAVKVFKNVVSMDKCKKYIFSTFNEREVANNYIGSFIFCVGLIQIKPKKARN